MPASGATPCGGRWRGQNRPSTSPLRAGLLSTSGEADLSSFNASCDSPAVLDATASCAVLFGRLVARRFAAAKASALAKAVERGAPPSEIALAAEACVAALVSKRVTLERSPSAVSVDPRYLVFELTASVVLRDQQLELVRTFRQALTDKSGLVHQMVMGAGKNDCCCPLTGALFGRWRFVSHGRGTARLSGDDARRLPVDV